MKLVLKEPEKSLARTNISLPPELLAKAKEYNINISQAARDGIVAAIRREMEIEELLKK